VTDIELTNWIMTLFEEITMTTQKELELAVISYMAYDNAHRYLANWRTGNW
jgi:hypothetical protein